MSIEVLNESGLEVDVRRTQRLAAFVMDRVLRRDPSGYFKIVKILRWR